ncbi:MFS transporter [Paraburkholderia domus]|uniref:MFS transporter n=1 Tax=Paraburkholderia domus TaxID=2793075 RepID=UPI001B0E71DE|nr:MFS transporter [Paraburkholderia domus]CAE6887938.1 3-hydroxybenzoate transporter MhbT [Paraburkholderia domus]
MKPVSPVQIASPLSVVDAKLWMLGLVCFCVMAVDGFDTASIAYVAPTLAREWNIAHAALTPAFVATSIGAVLGYVSSGALVARLGRRRLIVLAIVAFALLSLGTTLAGSIMSISVIRLVTAVCLGWAVPATISCIADHAGEQTRAAATIAATTGLSAGAGLGGLLASLLIAHHGWQSVFIAGGILPLALQPFVWVALGGTDHRQHADASSYGVATQDSAKSSSIAALFQGQFAFQTIVIWSIAFVAFLVTYQFMFWVPTLLVSYGFSPASAALGSAANAIGGIAGNMALLLFVGRYGVQRSLMVTACLAIGCIVCLGLLTVEGSAVLLLIVGVGAGTTSACVGQATLAVMAYPPALRTTGVGCAAAAGRVGAVVGPAIGGILLTLGFAPQRIVLVSCLPIFLIVGLLAISQFQSRRAERVCAGID